MDDEPGEVAAVLVPGRRGDEAAPAEETGDVGSHRRKRRGSDDAARRSPPAEEVKDSDEEVKDNKRRPDAKPVAKAAPRQSSPILLPTSKAVGPAMPPPPKRDAAGEVAETASQKRRREYGTVAAQPAAKFPGVGPLRYAIQQLRFGAPVEQYRVPRSDGIDHFAFPSAVWAPEALAAVATRRAEEVAETGKRRAALEVAAWKASQQHALHTHLVQAKLGHPKTSAEISDMWCANAPWRTGPTSTASSSSGLVRHEPEHAPPLKRLVTPPAGPASSGTAGPASNASRRAKAKAHTGNDPGDSGSDPEDQGVPFGGWRGLIAEQEASKRAAGAASQVPGTVPSQSAAPDSAAPEHPRTPPMSAPYYRPAEDLAAPYKARPASWREDRTLDLSQPQTPPEMLANPAGSAADSSWH
jgi:hypothetical protein